MPTMRLSLRTGLTIRTGKRGATPHLEKNTHNMQNSRYNKSGRTICSSNHTMGHRFTACTVWAHQFTPCTTGQQCGSNPGDEQEDPS
eukprot:1094435-Amphidinium_carterae.1